MKLPYHGVRAYLRFGWYEVLFRLASLYRRFLGHCRFVGVTGSSGKTTTKELIGAMLATQGPCWVNSGTHNMMHHVAHTILKMPRRYQFCVHELGGPQPNALAKTVKMFRPHIGVVTQVGYDHYTAYRGLEAIAAEKAKLVEALPASGAAVLNADDPRVLAMRERTRARVLTYGLSEEAMVRGEDIVSAWPETLSLSVVYARNRLRVQTRLLGEHWASAVLAALATGIALGLPLEEAARAIGDVPPVYCRLSPHAMPDGVTFIQDSWKAAFYTFPASLRFLKTAHAARKVAIIGTISDAPGKAPKRYRQVAQQALKVADRVIFVGQWAPSALKGAPPEDAPRLFAFDDIYKLRPFLRDFLTAGDLVLLKGSATVDHLERLVLDWETEFPCWRLACKRMMLCPECRYRHRPFVPAS